LMDTMSDPLDGRRPDAARAPGPAGGGSLHTDRHGPRPAGGTEAATRVLSGRESTAFPADEDPEGPAQGVPPSAPLEARLPALVERADAFDPVPGDHGGVVGLDGQDHPRLEIRLAPPGDRLLRLAHRH